MFNKAGNFNISFDLLEELLLEKRNNLEIVDIRYYGKKSMWKDREFIILVRKKRKKKRTMRPSLVRE